MTGFSLLFKPTRFLSLNLARFSLFTLHFCKSFASLLASKTLSLFTMDDLFPNDDDFWDLDVTTRSRPPQRPRLLDDYDYDDNGTEKVYFVSYRWWKETQNEGDQIGGVLYSVSSNEDADSGILLDLRKEEVPMKDNDNLEVGFSGREYALIGEAMWLHALKRHNDLNAASNDVGQCVKEDEVLQDVFPLQIRISLSWETNLLTVKINQKDNKADFYKRASIIFSSNSELFHIWDFSGQTSILFTNDMINSPDDCPAQRGKEVLLVLQVHEFYDSLNGKYGKKMKQTEECSKTQDCSIMDGITDQARSYLTETSPIISRNSLRVASFMGLTGLQNLGNTCFMNSAVQCLVHTPELVDYFLGNYQKEINYENPLGMKGELALAFGDLLRKLWAPESMSVSPRMFKLKLSNFAPQFSGYNQHDSQEFLAFLLDGLHEDLNRVKCKPYTETNDVQDRADEEVAEDYWQNHLARNDSIIVHMCQGQYRSTLLCPACKKLSVTFDPFMYLSLPLPSTSMRSMTLMVFSCDGVTFPSTFTISVPESGRLKDLSDALSAACSLGEDETLLVAEVYKNRIFRFLEDPSDSLALIRNEDKLVAYRLPKDSESSRLIVYMHQELEEHDNSGKVLSGPKTFGIPFVTRVPNPCYGSDIRQQFLKLLDPLKMPAEDIFNNCDGEAGISTNDGFEMDDDASCSPTLDVGESSNDGNVVSNSVASDFIFYFYLASGRGATEDALIKSNEPVTIFEPDQKLEVVVMWPDTMIKKYDTCLISILPDVFKPYFLPLKPHDSVFLYKCLEAFLKEEPLGPDDMWYCPCCKRHQQARKKLDLWRLPEILVIHLKRFSYSRFLKNKLETFVDFPIDNLDFSPYIAYKNNFLSNRYMLYAVSNHYGGMGGGHYTAYVLHGGKWYEFDDECVSPISKDLVKSMAAYVLFYKRISEE